MMQSVVELLLHVASQSQHILKSMETVGNRRKMGPKTPCVSSFSLIG